MEVIHYITLSIFTYGLIGVVIFSLLMDYITSKTPLNKTFLDKQITAIISIGLSLPIVTLILYYSFLIVPRESAYTYLGFILLLTLSSLFIQKKRIEASLHEFYSYYINNKQEIILFVTLFIIVLVGHTYYVFNREISEHDYLEYGTLGQIFFRDRIITYQEHRFDNISRFYYVGLHGFLFPLSLTWESLYSTVTERGYDTFYKGISGIYAILSLTIFYTICKKLLTHQWAVLATMCLALTLGFFIISLRFHIDTFRLFFFIISTYLLFINISFQNKNCLILLAIILGVQSFAHSLGAFLSFIGVITFFLFSNGNIKIRLLNSLLIMLVVLLFGGIHYLIDIFWGTGWIFKDMKFY